MYDFKEFIEEIKKELERKYFDCRIKIDEIEKNNGVVLQGLQIINPDSNIFPNIYLNEFYQGYQRGESFSDILNQIIQTYEAHKKDKCDDAVRLLDYDWIKNKIVFKLINYERNSKHLEKVPHFRFLDLAIVFEVLVEDGVWGKATVLIQNQLFDNWNIDKDSLFELAKRNTPGILKMDIDNMANIISDLADEEIEVGETPMFVMTNKSKMNGAGCILYPEALKQFAEKIQCDLFILPSSIHEVILVPARDDTEDTCRELNTIVQLVNCTQLSEVEFLADHVYHYSRGTDEITMR